MVAGTGGAPPAHHASACPGAETLCFGQITSGQPCSCLSAEGRRLVGIPHGPILLLPPPFPLPPFPSARKRKQGSPVVKTFTSARRLRYELLLRSTAGRFLAKGDGEGRVLRQATPGAAARACDVGQRPPGPRPPGTATGSPLGVTATLKHRGHDQEMETLLGSPVASPDQPQDTMESWRAACLVGHGWAALCHRWGACPSPAPWSPSPARPQGAARQGRPAFGHSHPEVLGCPGGRSPAWVQPGHGCAATSWRSTVPPGTVLPAPSKERWMGAPGAPGTASGPHREGLSTTSVGPAATRRERDSNPRSSALPPPPHPLTQWCVPKNLPGASGRLSAGPEAAVLGWP